MKFKLPKMTVQQMISAAKGEFEIDITDELLKSMGMDDEAKTLGLLTKSETIGNSETDKTLAKISTDVDAITAALTANNKAIMEAAAPLQPQGDMVKVLADISAGMLNLKSSVDQALEKFALAITSIEAIKAEMVRVPVAGATTGPITPDMTNFLHAQDQALKNSKSEASLFEFDSIGAL